MRKPGSDRSNEKNHTLRDRSLFMAGGQSQTALPEIFFRVCTLCLSIDAPLFWFCSTPLAMNNDPSLSYAYVCLSVTFFMQCLLRLPHTNDAKIAKICNLWTFWLVIQVKNHLWHLFKIQKKAFCPMFHKWNKCISKVASVGGGENANLKACDFSHFQF